MKENSSLHRDSVINKLLAYREPAVIAILLYIVINLVGGMVFALWQTMNEDIPAAMGNIGNDAMGMMSVFGLVAAVILCVVVQPMTRYAEYLAKTSAVVVLIGTLITLGNLIAGTYVPHNSTASLLLWLINGLADLGLKIFAVLVLWTLGQKSKAMIKDAPVQSLEIPATEELSSTSEPVDSRKPVDPTSGGMWSTASAAATGGDATWGTSDDQNASGAAQADPSLWTQKSGKSDPS